MRKLIYILLIGAFILAVIYKARLIEIKEKKESVNITEEWKKHGKPVDVVSVEKGVAHCIEKVSGVVQSEGIISGEVSSAVVAKLQAGQKFTATIYGQQISGIVDDIETTRDVISGLFGVDLKITSDNDLKKGAIVVAKVRVNTLWNILKIPKTAVVGENSHSWCWVVVENKIYKRNIELGIDCGNDVHVVSGLSWKDRVCVNGLNEISDNDIVRIRYTEKK